jgi:hypothetical protein
MSEINSTETAPQVLPVPPAPPVPPGFAATDPTPAPPAKPKSGLATAALVLGIVAIVSAVIPGLSFVAWVPAVVALTLGTVALVRKSGGRGKALSGVILGPIAIIIAIGVSIAAIAGLAPRIDNAPDGPAPVTSEPDKEQENEPEPATEEGTRANPAPAGSTVEISDNSGPIWSVTIGAANLNAGDVIAAENQFNTPADAGFQYALVPVTYTYVGAQTGTPWLDLDIEFVSKAGTTHEQAFVVIPTPVTDIGELYAGASATGNIAIMIPSVDVEAGAWTISTLFSEKYFVKVV